jgi:hypothetical protein
VPTATARITLSNQSRSSKDACAGPPTAPAIQTKHRHFAERTIHYQIQASHSRRILHTSSYSTDRHSLFIRASILRVWLSWAAIARGSLSPLHFPKSHALIITRHNRLSHLVTRPFHQTIAIFERNDTIRSLVLSRFFNPRFRSIRIFDSPFPPDSLVAVNLICVSAAVKLGLSLIASLRLERKVIFHHPTIGKRAARLLTSAFRIPITQTRHHDYPFAFPYARRLQSRGRSPRPVPSAHVPELEHQLRLRLPAQRCDTRRARWKAKTDLP